MAENKLNLEELELLQLYVSGEMKNPNQKEEFMKLLAEDERFQEELEYFKQLEQYYITRQSKQLSKKITDAIKYVDLAPDFEGSEALLKRFRSESIRDRWRWLFSGRVMGVLASIAVLIGITVLILVPGEEARVYIDMGQFKEPLEKRVAFGDGRGTLGEAFTAYYEEDYDKAIFIFEKYLTSNPSPMGTLYLGSSYFLTDKIEPAIERFEQLIDIEEKSVEITAKWNLSLAYLQYGDFSKGIALLKELEDDPIYQETAQRILNKLTLN